MSARPGISDLVVGLPRSRDALAFAERLHAGQRRQVDGSPFVHHLVEVAGLLHAAGAPDHLIAAGVLHDALEKSAATVADLADRFGPRIAGIVLAMTEDERIADHGERKAAAREQAAAGGHEVLMVLAADKISKVRELARETSIDRRRRLSVADESQRRRFVHYRECLLLLEQRLADSSLVVQLRAELERVAAQFDRHALVEVATRAEARGRLGDEPSA